MTRHGFSIGPDEQRALVAAEKPELREVLGRAVDGLNRGVVAYAGAI